MSDGESFKAIIVPSGAFRNRNGSHERTLWADGNIRSDFEGYMDGAEVFSFAVTRAPRLIKSFMNDNGRNIDDYDAFIVHQANLYIMKHLAKKIKISMDKVPVVIDRYGNTSGSSLPLTLCETWGNDNSGKLNVLMCGFGSGLSLGVAEAEICKSDILPVAFTDDYYKEGGVSHG